MALDLFLIGGLTITSAVAAMSLRHLVHCALCLVGAFVGIALLYLRLGAQFVGFAQILVYVGAVAVLIVFAILLTRNSEAGSKRDPIFSPSWFLGICVAVLVFVGLLTPIFTSPVTRKAAADRPPATVQQIGDNLMHQYVLPLEIVALLLTSAMIGAVIIAMHEKPRE